MLHPAPKPFGARGDSTRDQYIGCGFYSLYIQSTLLQSLNTTFATMDASDNFGYMGAYAPGLVPDRSTRVERDELQEVMMDLRMRFGRRRLFRVAEVAESVRTVRRRRIDPDYIDTPPRTEASTVRRTLRMRMNID